MNTIVINLLAGPGAGKSTTAAGIFYRLKKMGIDCELVTEYAKDCVWNESYHTMEDLVYMFGKLYHRIWKLLGKVLVIIVDSPILLSSYYKKFESKYFDKFVLELYSTMNNLTYIIDRDIEFVLNGRVHTEEESKQIDTVFDNLMHDNNLEHYHTSTTTAVDDITAKILHKMWLEQE